MTSRTANRHLNTPQSSQKQARTWRWDRGVSIFALVACAFLVAVPLVSLLYASLRTGSPGDPAATYTLSNWATLLKPNILRGLLNTFQLAIVSTVGSMVLGVLIAWLVARTDMPGRGLVQVAAVLPLLVSALLITLSWIALAGPNAGMINLLWQRITGLSTPLFDIYSFSGMAFLMILHYVPFVFLLVVGGLRAVDSSLEDAARVHGGGVLFTLRRVVLPVLAPTLLSAGLLVFVLSTETFTIPTLLGGSSRFFTVQYYLYTSVAEYPSDPGLAGVLGTFLLVVTVAGIWLQQRLLRYSKRFVTVTGKSVRQHLVRLGGWRYPALGLCLLYLLLSVVLPLLTLVMSSFMRYMSRNITLDLLTVDNYVHVFRESDGLRSLSNSLMLAFVGSTVTLVFCAVLSFLIVRGRTRLTRTVEFLTALPLSIPGLSLALGMLWGYIYLPIGVYGTVWLLLIAYVTRFMSFGVRIFSAGVAQIDPELEEAARVAGCTPLQSMRKVTFPILRPAAVAAWTLLFVQIILELPLTIILYTGNTLTAPVNIWRLAYGTTFAPAFAMATLLMAVGAVVIVAGQYFFGALRYMGSTTEH